jgi:uncharacterized protein (TIGR00730 family)
MENIGNICVYCGASNNVRDVYKQAAAKLGRVIGEGGRHLIYGGGRSGLMGIVADSVLSSGGKAVGIIPEHLQAREVRHTDLTELHIVPDMHTRKKMMMDRADAFVVLAGGLGTLEEFFEILTWKQLGIHDKPIIIVNIDGYWDKLLGAIDHIIDLGFAKKTDRQLFTVVGAPEDIFVALCAEPQPHIAPQTERV